jgi:hypothetical protein
MDVEDCTFALTLIEGRSSQAHFIYNFHLIHRSWHSSC